MAAKIIHFPEREQRRWILAGHRSGIVQPQIFRSHMESTDRLHLVGGCVSYPARAVGEGSAHQLPASSRQALRIVGDVQQDLKRDLSWPGSRRGSSPRLVPAPRSEPSWLGQRVSPEPVETPFTVARRLLHSLLSRAQNLPGATAPTHSLS